MPVEQKKNKSDTRDLRVPITDKLRKYGGMPEHPDEQIRTKGKDYFKVIEKDTHLTGELDVRAVNAIIPGWTVEPVDNDHETADFIRDNLNNVKHGFANCLKGIHTETCGKGFALYERIFKQQEIGRWSGKYMLARLKHIPVEYIGFDFDETGDVKPNGVIVDPISTYSATPANSYPYNRFLHTIFGTTDNPYGKGVDLDCAFWVFLKKVVTQFRAVYAENFGSPQKRVKLKRQIKKDSEDWNLIVNLIEELRNESGFIVPQGVEVDFLEAIRGSDTDYENFIDRCNKEISKRILGATLTVEGGGRGQGASYALGKQHGGITDNIAWFDSLWLEYIVQTQIIPYIMAFNFDLERPHPRFRILDDDFARIVALSQSLGNLASIGVIIPESWAREQLNIPQRVGNEPVLSPVGNLMSQPGIDNRIFSHPQQPIRFADEKKNSDLIVGAPHAAPALRSARLDALSFSEQATDELDRLALRMMTTVEQAAASELQPAFADLITQLENSAEQFPAGQRITDPTPPDIDLNPLIDILRRARWQLFLAGQVIAIKEIDSEFPSKLGLGGRKGGSENDDIPFADEDYDLLAGLFPDTNPVAAVALGLPITESQAAAFLAINDDIAMQIAGIIGDDLVKARNLIALTRQEGWSVAEFKAAVRESAVQYTGDVFGVDKTGQMLSGHHAETIYRNDLMQAYSDGRRALTEDPDIDSIIWGYTWRTVGDNRVRSDHAALNGVTLPKDHEFWTEMDTPLYHGCRCRKRIVTYGDIQSGKFTPKEPPDGWRSIPHFK